MLAVLGPDFEDLLAQAQRGSRAALSAIYRDVHPSLLAYLRARDPAEAEDLASQVWLDVAAGLNRFTGDEASFRAWVFTIARRRVIDLRRRRSRRRTDVAAHEALEDVAGAGPGNVEAEILARLGTDQALALLNRLPAHQAEVVRLRVIGGLDVEATARVLGKQPGYIRVLQHRALRRLARDLEQERAAREARSEDPGGPEPDEPADGASDTSIGDHVGEGAGRGGWPS